MELRRLELRRLKEEELRPALNLVWEVFEEEIKKSYSAEGTEAFLDFIDYDTMKSRVDNEEMLFWGAFEDEMIGTLAVRPDGHIALFFVKREYQGQGVGKALFQIVYNYLVEEKHVQKITVNAAPQSVAKYIHMGMRQTGNMEEKDGIRSVPMEMYASPTLVKPVRFQKKKNWKPLWIALTIIAVLMFAGMVFAGYTVYRLVSDVVVDEKVIDDVPIGKETGVEAIPEYKEDNLPYEIRNDAYNFMDDEKLNTVIEFSVQYPKLESESMDKAVVDKVNQAIYDCAMQTVDEIYTHPTEEIKEEVLETDMPVLVSYVTYKVTYQSDELISIVMEDMSYRGSQEAYLYDFRTLNVDLTSGEVYEVKDIVRLDKVFIKEWIKRMRSEADDRKLLSELNKKEMIKVLEGDTLGGIYHTEYFFDAEGVEIGLTFHFDQDDKNNNGFAWVTAPFTKEDITKFKTESAIWNEMN